MSFDFGVLKMQEIWGGFVAYLLDTVFHGGPLLVADGDAAAAPLVIEGFLLGVAQHIPRLLQQAHTCH
jgi:hypothetical protein